MQGKETKNRREEAMSFEGFYTCVRIDIQHRLGEDAEVTVNSTLKNNGIRLYGITIKEKGCNLVPTIYLEDFYERYLEGEDISALEREILYIYREKPAMFFDTDSIKDWQNVRERIVCRLINLEMNREKLEEIPYFPRLDLAVTFSVIVEAGELPCDGSFTIHNSHMEMWGITADELYAEAVGNTRRLEKPEIISLEDALLESIGEDAVSEEEQRVEPVMYVMTNEKRVYGASSLLFTDMLQELSDRTGSDLYILPSSIHELILIPEKCIKGCGGQEGLEQMVKTVNSTQIQPQEILSDKVYKFIRETGEITM